MAKERVRFITVRIKVVEKEPAVNDELKKYYEEKIKEALNADEVSISNIQEFKLGGEKDDSR
jgi:hypothetical protein